MGMRERGKRGEKRMVRRGSQRSEIEGDREKEDARG